MLDTITANALPIALIALGAIIVLWIARPYVRQVLSGISGAPARTVRGAALRLRAESRRVDRRYKARVREHLRQELEDRLWRTSRQLEGRLQADLNRADATLMRLRDSADALIRAADDADPQKIAQRVIDELKGPEGAKKTQRGGAIAQARAGIAAAAKDARNRARALKPEARRIVGATNKLRLIEHKLSRHAHDMNDAAERYEQLVASEARKHAAGDASIFVPWFAALVVIAIAAAGAILNFQLIARPMAELVGDGARVAGLSLAALAAFTLILLEAAAGVVLMESAGATQMLPVFRRMSGGMRAGFAFAALFFLCVFSVVEVALAFTREAILALEADVLRAAAGESAAAAPAESLPVALIAQALLGGAIPWILAVVAIPAETVINNTRFLVEAAWKHILAVLAFTLAALGGLLREVSRAITAVYDLTIFPALAVEKVVRGKPKPTAVASAAPAKAANDAAGSVPALPDAREEPELPALADQRVLRNGARA